jgi:hypothetical protein
VTAGLHRCDTRAKTRSFGIDANDVIVLNDRKKAENRDGLVVLPHGEDVGKPSVYKSAPSPVPRCRLHKIKLTDPMLPSSCASRMARRSAILSNPPTRRSLWR